MSNTGISTIEVVAYDAPGFRSIDLANLVPRIEIPQGFTVNGGERKFVVLKRGSRLVIAIGPVLDDHCYYYHREIPTNGLQVSGGGSVTFKKSNRYGWSAKFHGSSGDFGVFDPIILLHDLSKAIASQVKMTVEFDWQNSVKA